MARVPEEELARLKAEVSLERLAEGAGVELARHGADLVGLCPFHDDREPSLVITPGKNLWHCFGACAAGGSVIDDVFMSADVYQSAEAAQNLLSLPTKPGYAVAFAITTPYMLTPVQPRQKGELGPNAPPHDTPGGGSETLIPGTRAVPIGAWALSG